MLKSGFLDYFDKRSAHLDLDDGNDELTKLTGGMLMPHLDEPFLDLEAIQNQCNHIFARISQYSAVVIGNFE